MAGTVTLRGEAWYNELRLGGSTARRFRARLPPNRPNQAQTRAGEPLGDVRAHSRAGTGVEPRMDVGLLRILR